MENVGGESSSSSSSSRSVEVKQLAGNDDEYGGALEMYVFDMISRIPAFRKVAKSVRATRELLVGANTFLLDSYVGRSTRLDLDDSHMISPNWKYVLERSLQAAIEQYGDASLSKLPELLYALYGRNFLQVSAGAKHAHVNDCHHIAILCIYLLKRTSLYEYMNLVEPDPSDHCLDKYPNLPSMLKNRAAICKLVAENGASEDILPDLRGFYKKGAQGVIGTIFRHISILTLDKVDDARKKLKRKRKRVMTKSERKALYKEMYGQAEYRERYEHAQKIDRDSLSIDARRDAMQNACWDLLTIVLDMDEGEGFRAVFDHSIEGDEITDGTLFDHQMRVYDELSQRSCIDVVVLSGGIIGSCLSVPVYIVPTLRMFINIGSRVKGLATALGIDGDRFLQLCSVSLDRVSSVPSGSLAYNRFGQDSGHELELTSIRREAFVLYTISCALRDYDTVEDMPDTLTKALTVVLEDWYNARCGDPAKNNPMFNERSQLEHTTSLTYTKSMCQILSGLLGARVMLRIYIDSQGETVEMYPCRSLCRFDSFVFRVNVSPRNETRMLPIAGKGCTITLHTKTDFTKALFPDDMPEDKEFNVKQIECLARRVIMMALYHRGGLEVLNK